ncbi:gag/pol protein [Cucumis melo var. makuwa]|uniref:Gag/pol protein n=1 Tax=Cucumis melo var. makuwa TaxID=1194695 RepID=A0A5A7VGU9_CUCMM|nr:gag/pol protein [Cucumis melo var. makuwa]
MPRRSGRVIVSQPNHYLGLTETQVVIPDDGVEDPLSYKQAMNDVDKDQWVKAMDLEMESMYFNSVWELVDLPEGAKPIRCKWIYKRKRDSAGKSIRILLSIATFYDYEIWQMDVKTAFLNDNLKESIFISQPEGFITQGQEQKVCNLNRSIYGLKQSSRSWNIRFDTAIKSYGFDKHVDECGIPYFMWTISSSLGMMWDTLLTHGVHLSKEQCPKTPQEVEDMRRILYISVVGSLMYTMLCTRPDICYAVGIVRRYQSNPGLDHWTTVKIILKYLKRMRDYMLVYGAKDLILIGYTDSDFQTNKDSKKSTSGSVFTLNWRVVVWHSIKK